MRKKTMIIFVALLVGSLSACDDGEAGQQGGRPGGPEGRQRMPYLAAAAAELGVTEDALMAALGMPPGGGQPPANRS